MSSVRLDFVKGMFYFGNARLNLDLWLLTDVCCGLDVLVFSVLGKNDTVLPFLSCFMIV